MPLAGQSVSNISKKKLRKTYINQNPQDYFNLISDRSRIGTGSGVQPFHDWVNTMGYEQTQRGYANKLLSDPKLGYQKYMQKAYGVPKQANRFDPRGGGGGQRNIAQGLGAAKNAGAFRPFANQMRQQFLRLTPEQQGTYAAPYAMGPSRWSVFG